MTENMKKFIERMNQNGALKAELDALSKEYAAQNKDAIAQKTIAIAAKHGFTLTKEDFAAEPAELSEEQLKAVAGGGDGVCVCVVGGYGGGLGKNGNGWCACAVGGSGQNDINKNGIFDVWCGCVIGGGGSTGPNG